MKKIIALLLVITLASCKAKQQAVVAEQGASGDKTATEIIDGHYSVPKNFTSLYIRANADYTATHKGDKDSYNMSADIKIKKDEKILISIRVLGITMAKALITPQKIAYYERINSTYFEGSYDKLSNWLGTELDYAKVQNMLIGEAIYDLKKGNYKSSIENNRYKLQGKNGTLNLQFLFEGTNYLLKQQAVSQGGQQPRSLEISYPAHKEHAKGILPASVKIEAEQKEKVNIEIEYNTVTFDENLSFPFEVPEGFEQVFID